MRIRRLPVLDELTVDEETVVLLDERAVLLSPLASAALSTLSAPEPVWTSDLDLRGALEARFGVAPDPEAALFALVSELESAGLVELDQV
jgi:hypothetical protein